jgi:hypothetical protein
VSESDKQTSVAISATISPFDSKILDSVSAAAVNQPRARKRQHGNSASARDVLLDTTRSSLESNRAFQRRKPENYAIDGENTGRHHPPPG